MYILQKFELNHSQKSELMDLAKLLLVAGFIGITASIISMKTLTNSNFSDTLIQIGIICPMAVFFGRLICLISYSDYAPMRKQIMEKFTSYYGEENNEIDKLTILNDNEVQKDFYVDIDRKLEIPYISMSVRPKL